MKATRRRIWEQGRHGRPWARPALWRNLTSSNPAAQVQAPQSRSCGGIWAQYVARTKNMGYVTAPLIVVLSLVPEWQSPTAELSEGPESLSGNKIQQSHFSGSDRIPALTKPGPVPGCPAWRLSRTAQRTQMEREEDYACRHLQVKISQTQVTPLPLGPLPDGGI